MEINSSSPNDYQVGGSHYVAEYQHWDLVVDNRLPYLESQTTKYITRFRKKNGVQDIQKAIHYLEKLQTVIQEGRLSLPEPREIKNLDLFCQNNNIGDIEKT